MVVMMMVMMMVMIIMIMMVMMMVMIVVMHDGDSVMVIIVVMMVMKEPLTSIKLSPTKANNNLCPFLSIILAACSAFFNDVKSNTAMSGLPLSILNSIFVNFPSVPNFTASNAYSTSLSVFTFRGASKSAGFG